MKIGQGTLSAFSAIIEPYSTSILIFDSLQDRIEYRIENTE